VLRRQFPALDQSVHGHPLVYLDNAATTQKPLQVIRALTSFYERDNANVHRAIHELAERSTIAFEAARARVARFLNAKEPDEIVFTRGTTEAINLVAQSWGRPQLRAGDQILLSPLEHHSNLVPWQMICRQTEPNCVSSPWIAQRRKFAGIS
jgi:cysteine desulfurase/selenocysteine lyase